MTEQVKPMMQLTAQEATSGLILQQFFVSPHEVSLRPIHTERYRYLTDPDCDISTQFTRAEVAQDVMRLINLFGYGCAGKSTVARQLTEGTHSRLARLAEDMTREPRTQARDGVNEVEGEDLYSVTWDEFTARYQNGEYLVAYEVQSAGRPTKRAGIRTAAIKRLIELGQRGVAIVNLPAWCVLLRCFPASRALLIQPRSERDAERFYSMRQMAPSDRQQMTEWGQIPMPSGFHVPGMIVVANPYVNNVGLLANLVADQAVRVRWQDQTRSGVPGTLRDVLELQSSEYYLNRGGGETHPGAGRGLGSR
jgi:guanylate kinase